MKRVLVCSLLLLPVMAGCMPRTEAIAGVTVTPMLLKVSEPARAGENVTVQGRFLGGSSTGKLILGADERGEGGTVVPAASVVSWTDSQIVFRVPSSAPSGGSWLFVQVADMRSTGLPFSVKQ